MAKKIGAFCVVCMPSTPGARLHRSVCMLDAPAGATQEERRKNATILLFERKTPESSFLTSSGGLNEIASFFSIARFLSHATWEYIDWHVLSLFSSLCIVAEQHSVHCVLPCLDPDGSPWWRSPPSLSFSVLNTRTGVCVLLVSVILLCPATLYLLLLLPCARTRAHLSKKDTGNCGAVWQTLSPRARDTALAPCASNTARHRGQSPLAQFRCHHSYIITR